MRGRSFISVVTLTVLGSFLGSTFLSAAQTTQILPAGTKLYLVTDHEVSSKRGESDVGTIVPCRVWRDVENEGTLFIKAGTLAGCRVDKVKRRNMGGIEGKVSIAAIDTRSVDGQSVILSGGYGKEGSGRKAVVWTVGLLLLWPVLFVPGGSADLPPGTVFDASTVNDLRLTADTPDHAPARLDLSSLSGATFTAEALLDEFLKQSKPEVLKIKVSTPAPLPTAFVIDSVNGKQIDPLALKITNPTSSEDSTAAVCEVSIKTLAKHFQKGINRFDVAYMDGKERKATEVVLDVQF